VSPGTSSWTPAQVPPRHRRGLAGPGNDFVSDLLPARPSPHPGV